ncbi:MAG: molybdopterin-dependent oxidoreductase [Candidatus Pacebacteria bacterium]|nr:molybdopterin-dependent oxidoreductase [Candidatus Paceibacterota bacterium]
MKKRLIFKDLVILLLVVSFCVLAFTGILKFKKVYSFLPASSLPDLFLARITKLHEFSALVLIFLVLTHLLIQRAWFKQFYQRFFSDPKTQSLFMFFLLFLLLFLIARYLFVRQLFPFSNSSRTLNQLAAVEVRQYEGENLSSIKSFRENSIKGPQKIDIDKYRFEITGLVGKPASLTYEEVLNLPVYNKVVTLNCVEGWSSKILWEGVVISDLLQKVQVKPEADTIIFHAYDGYTTSLSLDFVQAKNILLAYKMNGVILPPERGFPFQVVAEDKWGYKWVKWVTKIELSDNTDYKGYWESAGYSRDGDFSGPKFEKQLR